MLVGMRLGARQAQELGKHFQRLQVMVSQQGKAIEEFLADLLVLRPVLWNWKGLVKKGNVLENQLSGSPSAPTCSASAKAKFQI